MAESEDHLRLKKIALRFLREKVTDVVVNEVEFKCGTSDAVGLNYKRKEVRIVECKAVKSDYTRDKKLFSLDTSYYPEAHYFYIMCPKDIIKPEEVVDGIGLIFVDEYDNYEIVKKPVKNKNKLKTLFDTTLKNAVKRMSNELYFSDSKQYKDPVDGRFSRNAKIKYVSIICHKCRKANKDLIHIDSKTIKCKCGQEIDLSKARIREITAYNKTFIKKINELNNN